MLRFRYSTEMVGAAAVSFEDDCLVVRLFDGRAISVDLAWFNELHGASEQQLKDCQILDCGQNILWPKLDLMLPVKGLMSPHPFHREQPGDDPYVVAQLRTPAEILERLKAVWEHEHSSQQKQQDADSYLTDEIDEARGLSDKQASRIKKNLEKHGL